MRGLATCKEISNVGTLDPSGSVVTDASVSPDGRRVTVRTYGSALEYDLPDGAPLTGIWKQAPRVARLDDGPKGEGITYRADGWAVMTIGENSIATLFQTALEC